jgi:O-antigen ligase
LILLYGLFWVTLLGLLFSGRSWHESHPLPPLPPAETDPFPFLGIQVEPDAYASATEWSEALDQIKQAGFGWVRLRVDWATVQPTGPQDWAWARTDQILADLAQAALIPVVTLDGSPAWARRPQDQANPLAPPQDFGDFGRFVAAFAQRYGDQVSHYQIWDEPNVAPHWGAQLIEPVAYAQLLAQSVPGLRQADPQAVVILAALAPTQDRGHTGVDEVHFLRRLLAAGAAAHFDVVAIQPYGFANPPQDERSRVEVLNFQRARLIRRVMVAAGKEETPIWATSFGWNHQPNGNWLAVSPARQQRYAQEAIALAQDEWPWLQAMAWATHRPAAPAHHPRWGFVLADWAVMSQAGAGGQVRVVGAMAGLGWVTGWGLAWLLVVWRLLAAARNLGMGALVGWLADWPIPAYGAGWLLTGLLYFFATWPPLIGLCLLAAGLLIYARPLSAPILAAGLLPFHFQHKEIHLLLFTWTLPPSQAVLLAALPALGRSMGQGSAVSQGIGLLRGVMGGAFSGKEPGRWRLSLSHGLALGWLALGGIGAAGVWHWPGYARGLWEITLVPLLIYGMIRLWATSPYQARQVLWGLALGGAVAGAIGLLGWLQGAGTWVDEVRRLQGLTFSPNQTALYLLRTLFLLLGMAIWYGRARPTPAGIGRLERLTVPGLIVAGGLVAVSLGLTGSRGGLLLGLPGGMAWAGLIWWRHRPGRGAIRSQEGWMLPGTLALILLGVAGMVGLGMGERLMNSATLLSRLAIWQGSLELVRDHLLSGVGPGGFYWGYPAYIRALGLSEPNLLHPHNVWLEMGALGGLWGLFWLLGLGYWLIRSPNGGEIPAWRLGIIAGMVAGLAHGHVDAFLALPELAGWLWVVMALNLPEEVQR